MDQDTLIYRYYKHMCADVCFLPAYTCLASKKIDCENVTSSAECWLFVIGTQDKWMNDWMSKWMNEWVSKWVSTLGSSWSFRIKFMKVKCLVIDVIKYLWQTAQHQAVPVSSLQHRNWTGKRVRVRAFLSPSDWWPKLDLALIDINYLKGRRANPST